MSYSFRKISSRACGNSVEHLKKALKFIHLSNRGCIELQPPVKWAASNEGTSRMSGYQCPSKTNDRQNLASREPFLAADDLLAAQLGDGKEANGRTNRPVNQTNPALFAAPHFGVCLPD